MGIIVRQSILNTIISFLGIALGFVTTILLYPNILEPEEIGLTRVLISLALVCSQFAHLGIKNIIIRYFPYFQVSEGSRGTLLTLSLLVPFIGFLTLTVLFFLFQGTLVSFYADESRLFREFNLYLIPLVLFVLFFEVLNSYIRALQDSVTGSMLNEVVMRLIIIGLLILYYFEVIGFGMFIAGFVFSYALQPIYLLIYLHRRNELIFRHPFKTGKHVLTGMGTYGAFALLGGLSSILVGNIDFLMLGSMSGLVDTGVYAIAFYIGSVISIPQRSIGKIAVPIVSEFIKNEDYTRIEALYHRTSLNQIVVGALLLIGLWANMDNLMALLPETFHAGRSVIIVIGMAKLFDMATGINGGIILNSKYYRFDLYANLFLVVITVTTNFWLIPIYGILGAAVASAISIFLYNLIKFVYVWKKFDMQPFRFSAFLVIVIAAGCLYITFRIPYMGNLYIDLPVRSAIITALYFLSILSLRISGDLNTLANRVLDTLKKR